MSESTSIPNVYKLTIYMTPKQWDIMSKWSANDCASCDPKRAPWLHLSHEHDKYDEYKSMMEDTKTQLEPYNIIVDDIDEKILLGS